MVTTVQPSDQAGGAGSDVLAQVAWCAAGALRGGTPRPLRRAAAGIEFGTVRRYQCTADRELTLMSVCRGYPEWIRICLTDQAVAARLQAQPHWRWSAEP